MILGTPKAGSPHDEHVGWRDLMAREGCPVCRATLIPEGTFWFGKYETFGDLADGKKIGDKVEYIIWSPETLVPPTKKFPNRPEAIKVAFKMAAENPGQKFYVAKLVGVAEVPTACAKYEDLER